MKLFGIHFVPLNTPLSKHLETISAFLAVFLSTYLALYGMLLGICFILFPVFWPFFIPYVLWMIADRRTPHRGGRPSDWVKSWSIFKYAKKYYPVTVKYHPNLKLDPKKNYLCCYFPHGTITTGPLLGYLAKTFEDANPFSNHQSLGVTLNVGFYIPFYREILLLLGFCSANAESINWILGYPSGGKMLGLIVGGASEAFYTKENEYRLVLKNRKGFIKLALKNGSPLIPFISFGENQVFRQFTFPEGSIYRRFQEWYQKSFGIAPIFLYGRGILQYNFGWVPLRTPITIVAGDVIDVPKVTNPSKQQIDFLHEEFIKALRDIFEKHKYEYEKNPEDCKLIIS